MKNNTHSNTALFLMELIAVIGFFSVVAVVCVRLFAAASTTSTTSVNINHAIRIEESLAESWIASDGDLNRLQTLYPQAVVALADPAAATDGTLTLYLDENWEMLDEATDGRRYSVTLDSQKVAASACYDPSDEGYAIVMTVTVNDLVKDTTISSLQADHYLGTTLSRVDFHAQVCPDVDPAGMIPADIMLPVQLCPDVDMEGRNILL